MDIYQYCFQNSKEFFCIINTENYFEIINPNFEKHLGYSEKELLENNMLSFVHPDDTDATEKDFEKLKSGSPIYDLVNRYRKKDGSYLWLQWNINPDPGTGKFHGIARDITEKIKTQEELDKKTQELSRSNIELEQFAYIASHDLQEPLRTVTSYLELLEKRYKDKLDEEANDFIHFAVEGSMRMRTLIQSLLEYSRVNRVKPFGWIDTNELLTEVIQTLDSSVKENKAIIHIDDLPKIYGDQVLINQLFQNLIENAIKFRGAKSPEIIISGIEKNNEYLFSVKDNGIGIKNEHFGRLFVVFQRLHTREEYPGVGIGLAICKKIVEKHGGKIWIESEMNEGSTFYFTIRKENLNLDKTNGRKN